MGTLVYATDIHLTDKQPINRVDPVYPRCLDKMNAILQLARENGKLLVLGGDLFDVPCPSYEIVEKTVNLFDCFRDVKTFIIRGNHDMRYLSQWEESAVSLLHAARLIQVLERDIYINGFHLIPFPYSRDMPVIFDRDNKYAIDSSLCAPRTVEEYDETEKDDRVAQVIIAHMPIVTEHVPYSHIYYKDIHTDADAILCGHIHCKFGVAIPTEYRSGYCHLINPGCITRLKRNEASLTPTIAIVTSMFDKVSYRFKELISENGPMYLDPVEFMEEENTLVNFEKEAISEDKKMDIDEITAYINSTDYPETVKSEVLQLIKEKQEVLDD